MTSTIPGFGNNFLANLPAVPQGSFTVHGGKNFLENLNAIVVPPKTYIPVAGRQSGV